VHATKSNSTPKEKKWGVCNYCSQKGFYSIQVEKRNTGELAQCFVEEESLLVTAFYVVGVLVCEDPECWGEEESDSSFYDAICVFVELYNFVSIFSLLCIQEELE
jgi:hypothetical protein